jgi:predicted RNA-binding Zn-ribbon protein involved in translation (DUF1610 family)
MRLKTKRHKLLRTVTSAELKSAVEKAQCVYDVMRELACSYSGYNAKVVAKMIAAANLKTNHFLTAEGLYKRTAQKNASRIMFPKEVVFCEKSRVCQNTLVSRFKKLELVDYVCKRCGQEPIWNNHSLTLQLDHINGVCNDNRVRNLRWLCPNCHTQTNTFARKNNGNVPKYISRRRQQNIDKRLAKNYRILP